MKAKSQYGEDEFILTFFGDYKGRFLDVGAYDGCTFSNTGQLAERGWSGVCVEPSPSVFPHLARYHDLHDVLCLNAAVTVAAKWMPFWDANGNAVSSVSGEHVQKYTDAGYPFQRCWICGVTWAQLLEGFPGPYDFLNIDVEGINAELVLACPLDTIGARLVCLEDDLTGERDAVLARFRAFGYAEPKKIGGNLLFAK